MQIYSTVISELTNRIASGSLNSLKLKCELNWVHTATEPMLFVLSTFISITGTKSLPPCKHVHGVSGFFNCLLICSITLSFIFNFSFNTVLSSVSVFRATMPVVCYVKQWKNLLCNRTHCTRNLKIIFKKSPGLVPSTRLPTVGERTYAVSASRVWNSLPLHVTSVPFYRLSRRDWSLSCSVTASRPDFFLVLCFRPSLIVRNAEMAVHRNCDP